MAAGQWARLTIEQRPEGETFNVSSRPWAAAPAAARAPNNVQKKARRRKPNKKRLAKKQLWQQSRGSVAAAAIPRHQQQQQLLQPVAAATAASVTYAQVAASPASPAKSVVTAAAAHCSGLVSSPRLTRAAKKRKECSPGDVAAYAFTQVDGTVATPPSSPPEPLTPLKPEAFPLLAALKEQPAATAVQRSRLPEAELMKPATCASPGPADHEPVNPPHPPPWSEYLPAYWDRVSCRSCLKGSHGYRTYTSCEPCYRRKI